MTRVLAAALLPILTLAGCGDRPGAGAVSAAIEADSRTFDAGAPSLKIDDIDLATRTYGVAGDQHPRWRIEATGSARALVPRYEEARGACPERLGPNDRAVRLTIPKDAEIAFRAELSADREKTEDLDYSVHLVELRDPKTGARLRGFPEPWWTRQNLTPVVCAE